MFSSPVVIPLFRVPEKLWMAIGQVIEAQRLPIFKVEDHFGDRVVPASSQANKLLGFNCVGNFAALWRANRQCCVTVPVVIHIHPNKHARRIETEFFPLCFLIGWDKGKGPKLSEWRADLPLALAPVDYA